VVCLDRGDRPADAAPWDNGRMTPINRNDVREANDEGARWASFLGVPFTPCEPVQGETSPSRVPEYGVNAVHGVIPTADEAFAIADEAMLELIYGECSPIEAGKLFALTNEAQEEVSELDAANPVVVRAVQWSCARGLAEMTHDDSGLIVRILEDNAPQTRELPPN
jgi:hypothetical protein